MMMNNSIICNYLDELFPNPKCELNYKNDYQLLISIVLSAQTTDKRVNMVTSVLYDKYNSLDKLSNCGIKDVENILRPLGSFRKKAFYVKKIAQMLHYEYNDIVPKDRDVLMRFPGVGRKTINVFLSEYYGENAIAVDTHVERVSKRLKYAYMKDNVLTVEKKLMKKIPANEWGKRHLQLVLFGRYYCKAVKPLCSDCKLKDICREKKKNFD